jgi:hypothetical protein
MELHLLPRKIEQDKSDKSDKSNESGDALYGLTVMERSFEIRESMGRFFACESWPSGRILKSVGNGVCTCGLDEPLITETLETYGPNYLLSRLKDRLDTDTMIYTSHGESVNSRYYDTLKEALEAIRACLFSNKQLINTRVLSDEEKERLQKDEVEASILYWKGRDITADAAMHDNGLFKGCHTMMGSTLSRETKLIILGYINNPNQEDWNMVRNYLIAGPTTLWQAWISDDASAPRTGSVGYPQRDSTISAIRHAVFLNRENITRKLMEIDQQSEMTNLIFCVCT